MKELLSFILLGFFLSHCTVKQMPSEEPMLEDPIVSPTVIVAEEAIMKILDQYRLMIPTVPEHRLPRNTEPSGLLRSVAAHDWTSGFYPGVLWYLYEYSKDELFLNEALKKTDLIENQKNNTGTHDLGFMLYNSFGNGYRISNPDNYQSILLTGAESLSSRFNSEVGCIKSWDWASQWAFPVIVDNMMNLEYLFWAARMSGDSTYYLQAISHADITMKNHYREDNSCYHVLDFNPNSGEVVEKTTLQGHSDSSIWARGQAWGLYGYTMMYRETKENRYLEQANKIVEFLFSHPNMNLDYVPYWDFVDPDIPNAVRDASSAAIIASALIELSSFNTGSLSQTQLVKAEKIITTLSSSDYFATLGTNNNFVLKHVTGHHPAGKEIDTAIIYGDYYFIEALLRYLKLKG